jgi:hypothetical protein
MTSSVSKKGRLYAIEGMVGKGQAARIAADGTLDSAPASQLQHPLRNIHGDGAGSGMPLLHHQ